MLYLYNKIKQIELMITVIFKSEKKAKIYAILSKNNEAVYEKGELIAKVKTDDIYSYMIGKNDFYYEEQFFS